MQRTRPLFLAFIGSLVMVAWHAPRTGPQAGPAVGGVTARAGGSEAGDRNATGKAPEAPSRTGS